MCCFSSLSGRICESHKDIFGAPIPVRSLVSGAYLFLSVVKIVLDINPESLKKVWVDEIRRIVHVKDMSVCVMLMVCACHPTVLNCVQWNIPPVTCIFSVYNFFIFIFFIPCHRKHIDQNNTISAPDRRAAHDGVPAWAVFSMA